MRLVAVLWLLGLLPFVVESADENKNQKGPRPDPRPIHPNSSPHFERNFKTISSIYDLTIYPNQLPIIESAATITPQSLPILSNLFAPTVSGRIQDIGNFTDFKHSIEYFFGLAPIPRAPTYIAISAFDLVQFSSQCPQVAASTVYFTISVADPTRSDFGKVLTYLKQSGFWHFDPQGRVDYYDLWIPALQDFAQIANQADFADLTTRVIATKQLCEGIQQFCQGPYLQYPTLLPSLTLQLIKTLLQTLGLSNTAIGLLGLENTNPAALNCLLQLLKKKFGTFDKLWSDTVACRIVHVILAQVDPESHCPHVGPSGGGKCVNYPYYNRLFDDIGLFGDKYQFRCPDRHGEL